MQITTATRTVEIYMNNETGITYRNTKDGVAYGPVRTANRATAKAGSVGAEILAAIDAQAAAEVETEDVAEAPIATATVAAEITVGTEVTVQGRRGTVTHIVPAEESRNGRAWAGIRWTTTESGAVRPSYGYAHLDELTEIQSRAADRIRQAVNLKW